MRAARVLRDRAAFEHPVHLNSKSSAMRTLDSYRPVRSPQFSRVFLPEGEITLVQYRVAPQWRQKLAGLHFLRSLEGWQCH
jgi:hypothetical protein